MAFPGLDVSPRETVADHLHVDEAVPKVNPANLPAITVHVDHVDTHCLAEHLGRECFPRLGSERLAFLGRVDAGEPDLVLHFGIVQDCQRITVRDRHDFAGDRVVQLVGRQATCQPGRRPETWEGGMPSLRNPGINRDSLAPCPFPSGTCGSANR